MKKIVVLFAAVAMLFSAVGAANVNIDGESFSGGKLINSVTYVPLRAFCEKVTDCDIAWDNNTRTASVESENLFVSARIEDKYLEANERYLYSGNENLIIDGNTYIPVRSLAKAFGIGVEWDAKTKTALLTTDYEEFKSADDFYNANDLYWLAKIISAESAGEPLAGKIAVGNVVLNRVKSPEYPNDIYGVIFDTNGGVQFTPVLTGTIENAPTEESIIAAKICLEGYKVSDKNVLFFLNPSISTSMWIPNNRDFVVSVGKHDFYA